MITEPMPAILSGQIHVFQPATRGAASRDRMLKGPVPVVPQWKELQNQLRGRLELQKVRVPKPVWGSSWPRREGPWGRVGDQDMEWGSRPGSQRIGFPEKGEWGQHPGKGIL